MGTCTHIFCDYLMKYIIFWQLYYIRKFTRITQCENFTIYHRSNSYCYERTFKETHSSTVSIHIFLRGCFYDDPAMTTVTDRMVCNLQVKEYFNIPP